PRVAGQPAVLVSMKLSADANIFAARREIQKVIEQQQQADDIEIRWLFDAEIGVSAKLRELGLNVLQGVAILALVLLFAVGYRSAFIISMMLPAALFMSLVGLAFTDYGVQEISLAGFIIALGLIVDNGIVVTENAYKLNFYRGHAHPEAAVLGTSSVIMPLLSSTATTALAFAPLFLLTSDTGLFLHSLVAVIWLCLAASLVAAVVMSSVLIARLGTEPQVKYLPTLPSFLVALIPFRDGIYRNAVFHFIYHPGQLALIVLGLFVLTGFAASQLRVIVFPESEDPYFTVDIKAPMDRNHEYMRGLTQQVTNAVLAREGVEQCSSVQGGSFPMVNTGASRVAVRRSNSQLFCSVNFRDAVRLRTLINNINQELATFSAKADVRASSFAVGSGAPLGDIEVHLRGQSVLTLRDTAVALENQLQAAGPNGLDRIDSDASSRYFALQVEFEERRASALGIPRSAVDRVLIMMMHGVEIDALRHPDGNEYSIVLRTEADTEDPLNVFDRMFVRSAAGVSVPLSQVVSVTFSEDEYDILHEKFEPRVSLRIFAAESVSVDALTAEVQTLVASFDLPAGVKVDFGGQLAQQADSFGGLSKYVGIIILVVLAIFVFQFGSVVQPLVICAAIPLSFIGAFLFLYVADEPMSFLAFIGLTSLMGIVINNSILLVDEGNQLRDENPDMSIQEVAVTAGSNRFMPILLTSITSIAGLLPLALGSSMFKSLSVAVIGGLATSTFLTLVCVPVLYAYTTRRKVS
ncbi:MAG: efflux RND transporter permease subunit, partial [Pseudomonadales bacterium]